MNFPLFRKYINNASYFRVSAEDEFEEIKLLGNHYSLIQIKTKILPERNYIEDLIAMRGGQWIEITSEEYDSVKLDCIQNKKLLA